MNPASRMAGRIWIRQGDLNSCGRGQVFDWYAKMKFVPGGRNFAGGGSGGWEWLAIFSAIIAVPVGIN